MKKLKLLSAATAIIGLSLSFSAVAKPNSTAKIDMTSCSLDTQSSIDFCSSKVASKVKQLSGQKPNFGDNSVLMRFWDSEMNYWVYLAVDKKLNKAFYYPRGLRSTGDQPRNVSVSFSDSKICTTGDKVAVVGDQDSKAYSDDDLDIDYCSDYDPKTEFGFGATYQANAKTHKLLSYIGI